MSASSPTRPESATPGARTATAKEDVWHTLPAHEAARRLQTDATRGLALAEVARRLRQYGPNALAETTGRSALAIFFDQFKSLIVVLLDRGDRGGPRAGRDHRGGRHPGRDRPQRGHRLPDRVEGGAGADRPPEADLGGGPRHPGWGGAPGPRGRPGAGRRGPSWPPGPGSPPTGGSSRACGCRWTRRR